MFLVLKEFEPTFSQGGDMAQGFSCASRAVKELEDAGESAMKASLAKGMPHGYEVGYRYFTINGRMLGHGEPVRVKQGERVLFHVLNGSATEIRSLALPGHIFKVVALDGNAVPNGCGSSGAMAGNGGTHFRDRRDESSGRMDHGRSCGRRSRVTAWALWLSMRDATANRIGRRRRTVPLELRAVCETWCVAHAPDETFEMTFAKDNAAEEGFNRWTINGVAYPMTQASHPRRFICSEGKRYRHTDAQCE